MNLSRSIIDSHRDLTEIRNRSYDYEEDRQNRFSELDPWQRQRELEDRGRWQGGSPGGSSLPAALAAASILGAVAAGGYLANKALKKTGKRGEILSSLAGAGIGGVVAGPPGAIAGAGIGGAIMSGLKGDVKSLKAHLRARRAARNEEYLNEFDVTTLMHGHDTLTMAAPFAAGFAGHFLHHLGSHAVIHGTHKGAKRLKAVVKNIKQKRQMKKSAKAGPSLGQQIAERAN